MSKAIARMAGIPSAGTKPPLVKIPTAEEADFLMVLPEPHHSQCPICQVPDQDERHQIEVDYVYSLATPFEIVASLQKLEDQRTAEDSYTVKKEKNVLFYKKVKAVRRHFIDSGLFALKNSPEYIQYYLLQGLETPQSRMHKQRVSDQLKKILIHGKLKQWPGFSETPLVNVSQIERMTIEQADGALQKIVMEILELENQAKVLESIKEKPDAKTTRK